MAESDPAPLKFVCHLRAISVSKLPEDPSKYFKNQTQKISQHFLKIGVSR